MDKPTTTPFKKRMAVIEKDSYARDSDKIVDIRLAV
jgi:hypothetical protein